MGGGGKKKGGRGGGRGVSLESILSKRVKRFFSATVSVSFINGLITPQDQRPWSVHPSSHRGLRITKAIKDKTK